MTTVTVHDVERDVLGFLRRVERGETLVIVRDDRPVAEVKPVPAPANTVTGLRPYGLAAGEFTVPADFDASLPEDVLADFEAK
ncbi:MAG: hypothetical protein JWO31_3879 [Phycisphaerales bacterium]|nr:hypothetical protein [Phycisphaerales bacterium]